MKNSEQIEFLTPQECKEIQGGGWGFDVGWFLGNTIVGNFLTPQGIAKASVAYVVEYVDKE